MRGRAVLPRLRDRFGAVVAPREPQRERGVVAARFAVDARLDSRGVEQRQEAVPIARDDLRQHVLAGLRAYLDHAVEPREHREAEARVVAAAVVVMIALAHRGPALIAFLCPPDPADTPPRSEKTTDELQSLKTLHFTTFL